MPLFASRHFLSCKVLLWIAWVVEYNCRGYPGLINCSLHKHPALLSWAHQSRKDWICWGPRCNIQSTSAPGFFYSCRTRELRTHRAGRLEGISNIMWLYHASILCYGWFLLCLGQGVFLSICHTWKLILILNQYLRISPTLDKSGLLSQCRDPAIAWENSGGYRGKHPQWPRYHASCEYDWIKLQSTIVFDLITEYEMSCKW